MFIVPVSCRSTLTFCSTTAVPRYVCSSTHSPLHWPLTRSIYNTFCLQGYSSHYSRKLYQGNKSPSWWRSALVQSQYHLQITHQHIASHYPIVIFDKTQLNSFIVFQSCIITMLHCTSTVQYHYGLNFTCMIFYQKATFIDAVCFPLQKLQAEIFAKRTFKIHCNKHSFGQ